MKHNVSCGWNMSAEAGVSLPETLVAMLILMMALVGVMSLVPLSMNLTSTGREYSILTNRARDIAETLLALRWNDPSLSPGIHRNQTDPDRMASSWTVSDRTIDLTSSAPPGRAGTGGNLKIISITVAGNERTGIGRRKITLVVMKGRD